jgi:hypothetical protein
MRTAGIATGLALAALLVLAFRVPASGHTLGAGVRVVAAAPGELHVPDGGAFLTARDLTPGGAAARARLPVGNVTRGPVDVRVRAHGGGRQLDSGLRMELSAGGRRLASGPLAALRHWSRPMRLERAGERTIRARAWIADGATDTAGRRVDLDLQLDADLVENARR